MTNRISALHPTYDAGVNDALDAIKSVTAKLPDGTNLPLEAVCKLVCDKLQIKRRLK